MTGSHLYVGKTDPVDFPSTPGQLPYSPGMEKSPSPSASYDDATMTYTILLDEIYSYVFVGEGQGKGLNAVGVQGVEPGDQIYIAAHAEVIRHYYEPVWQIGDVEENKLDNPCDEFNHPTLVYGTQSFYVDTTPAIEFPWISRLNRNYAPIINIYFNAEMLLGGKFLFSWSPGGSGIETIKILLDGMELGTVTRSGSQNSEWWEKYERFIDSFDVPAIDAGDHVLTINVTRGDGLVWDWLRLEEQCVQSETAWAEGNNQFFGKNWATYFNYTIPQCWSLIGEWKYTAKLGSSTFSHDMTINDDLFSGIGAYPSGGPYTIFWTVSGGIVGNNVDMTISYNSSLYWAHLIGTIDDDGTMSGTWTDSNGKAGTWESTEGIATPIYCN